MGQKSAQGRLKVLALCCLLELGIGGLAICAQQAGSAEAAARPSGSEPDAKKMESALLAQVTQHPASFAAQHELGEWYAHRDQLDKAIVHLENADGIDPADYGNGYDLALAYLQLQRPASATPLLNRMLQLSDKAELHNLLGEANEQANELKGAATEYYRAAQLEASEGNIFDLASFFLRHPKYEGFLDHALEYFRYGAQRYPQSAKLTVGLGVALYAEGKYDDAVKALCAAVDLDPGDPKPFVFLGRVSKSSPEAMPEIRRRLEDFVHRYPANGPANYYYAMSLWQAPEHDTARIEGLLRKAIEASPDFYEAHFQLGIVYQDQKKYSEAIDEFKRTIQLQPDFSRAHYRLVLMYNRVGQRQAADRELEILKHLKQEDDIDDRTGEKPKAAPAVAQSH